jgi:heme-degrading monooxygenase HmoA
VTEPAVTPEPPYYAVVFTSLRTPGDDGYAQASAEMFALVQEQPGFLGADSARSPDGLGITVAYFRDEDAIAAWRANAEHTVVRRTGRERWYDHYAIHVAKVERAYRFSRTSPASR